MKKFLLLNCFALFSLAGHTQDTNPVPHRDCASDIIQEKLVKSDSIYRANYEDMERQVQYIIQENRMKRQSGPPVSNVTSGVVYTIPVVVHVIHLGEPVGTGTNVSDAVIQGAINGANDRFRNLLLNGNDVEIQFCLATKDPAGNSTNGIVRVNGSSLTNYSSEGVDFSSSCATSANEVSLKNLSKWPNTDYYNIWIVKSVCNGSWGGYAYFPGASATYDGAVIVYNQLSYNDHTTAHELGHAFNLYHTFSGDASNTTCPANTSCTTDGDRLCDTPPHKQSDCGSSNPCTAAGIWDNSHFNYMSYCYYGWSSPNVSAGRFSPDQITRMRATLSVSPRSALLSSTGCSLGCLAPSNDLCDDAITLTVGSSCSYTSGTTCAATASSPGTGLTTCVLTPATAEDVWYKFVATQTTATIKVQGDVDFDPVFQLLSDVICSSSYTELECVNSTGVAGLESVSVSGLSIGNTYWIRVYNNSGLIGTDFQICVTECNPPAQPGTISGNASPCQGSTSTYSISAVSGATSYNWSASNGSVSGSGTSVSVTWGTGTSASIQVSATGICGTGTNRTLNITFQNAPAQPGAITGNSLPCQSSSNSYSIAAVSGATSYNWQATNGSVSGTGTSVSVTWGTGTSGSIEVSATGACGTSSNSTLSVTFSNAPTQPGAITGSSTPCESSNSTYSIAAVAGATSYNWSASNGTVTGSGTSVSVNWGTGTSGSIQVNAQNACGTSTNSTLNVTFSTVPNQPGSISGNANLCSGATGTYSILAVSGATSYNWSANNGTVSGSGTSVSVTWGSGTSGTIFVSSQGTCGASANTSLGITLIPGPNQPGAISGSSSLCAGASSTYSIAPVSGAVSYNWSASNGTISGTGTSVTVSWGSGSSGTIQVAAQGSCGVSSNSTLNVTLNNSPPQPGTITGNTSPCAGTSSTYSILAVVGATSYNWSATNGTVSGSGTSVSIAWGTGSSGTVHVTAQGTCGTSADRSLNINLNNIPAQPGSITGSNSLCEGSTSTYSISPVSGATSYSWSATNGTVSGSGTSVSVTWGNSSSGVVRVASVGLCGTSSMRTMNVSLIDIPGQPGVISGSPAPCEGSTETYSITPVPGASFYDWTISNGVLSGSGTTVSVTWNNGSSGIVRVAAENSCGTSANSTLNVSLASPPPQPGSISGNTNPCAGTTLTYSIAPVVGVNNYSWMCTGGTVSGNGTSASVTWLNGGSGNIRVASIGACGAGAFTILNVTVNTAPNQPGIITGDDTVCTGTTSVYSISPVVGANSYIWIAPNGTVSGSGTTVSITWASGSNSSVQVAADGDCGLSSGSILNVEVNDFPEAPVAISGDSMPCEGDTVLYNVIPVAGASTYYWVVGSGQLIGSNTGSGVLVYWPGQGNTLIQVAAINSCGQGQAFNDPINIRSSSSCITKVDAITSQLPYSIYPNPVNDILFIRGDFSEVSLPDISIINSLGQKIQTQSLLAGINHQELQMNLNQLTAGLYLFIITSEDSLEIIKFEKH